MISVSISLPASKSSFIASMRACSVSFSVGFAAGDAEAAVAAGGAPVAGSCSVVALILAIDDLVTASTSTVSVGLPPARLLVFWIKGLQRFK